MIRGRYRGNYGKEREERRCEGRHRKGLEDWVSGVLMNGAKEERGEDSIKELG